MTSVIFNDLGSRLKLDWKQKSEGLFGLFNLLKGKPVPKSAPGHLIFWVRSGFIGRQRNLTSFFGYR